MAWGLRKTAGVVMRGRVELGTCAIWQPDCAMDTDPARAPGRNQAQAKNGYRVADEDPNGNKVPNLRDLEREKKKKKKEVGTNTQHRIGRCAQCVRHGWTSNAPYH